MEIRENISYIKTAQLIPYNKNPRKNDKAVETVVKSIKEFGFKQPIVVDKDMVVIVGHTRLKAAKELGMVEVPVIIAKNLTKEQTDAYRLMDNRSNEYAKWDELLLADEIKALEGKLDLSLTGFTDREVQNLLDLGIVPPTEINLDEVPIDKLTVSQPGDLWMLDDSRVLCGDSTDIESYKKILDNKLADMIWSDPPYNIGYISPTYRSNKFENRNVDNLHIKNDKMDKASFKSFLLSVFKPAIASAKKGAAIYISHSESETQTFMDSLVESGAELKQNLIWLKNNHVKSNHDYLKMHEPIIYGYKKGANRYFTSSRGEKTKLYDSRSDWNNATKEELLEYVKLLNDEETSTVLYAPMSKNIYHPTTKPLELIMPCIKNSTRNGEKVLDMFGGSGSTLISAVTSDRVGYSIELEGRYCDVQIKRWQNLTGKKAINHKGELYDDLYQKKYEEYIKNINNIDSELNLDALDI